MNRTHQRVKVLVAGVSVLAVGLSSLLSQSEMTQDKKPRPEQAHHKLAEEIETIWVTNGGSMTFDLTNRDSKEFSIFTWRLGTNVLAESSNLVINAVGLSNVGTYTCEVHGTNLGGHLGGAKADGYGTAMTHAVRLGVVLVDTNKGSFVTTCIGQPGLGSGQNGTCGDYVGYLVFKPSSPTPPPWGFLPSTNWVGPCTAACTSDTNACVCFTSSKGRSGCLAAPLSVTPKPGEMFRFGIYFKTNPLPTACTLELRGF